jgi:hypothetical protein
MRGQFQDQGGMFSGIHPEKRITAKHPLRRIRELVREVFIRHPGPTFAEAPVGKIDPTGAILRASEQVQELAVPFVIVPMQEVPVPFIAIVHITQDW